MKRPPATVHAAIADISDAEFLKNDGGFDVWRIMRRGRPSDYARAMRASDLTFTGQKTTKHTIEVVRRFNEVLPGEIDKIGRHPRLTWQGQCPTLRAGTGSEQGSYQSVRPIHPEYPRVITVREAARLQGFPDYYRFHPTIWHSFRMIGNSVSPQIASAIFSAIQGRLKMDGLVATAAE
jgi:DNA (cytosine-5)-methyltransferase 1